MRRRGEKRILGWPTGRGTSPAQPIQRLETNFGHFIFASCPHFLQIDCFVLQQTSCPKTGTCFVQNVLLSGNGVAKSISGPGACNHRCFHLRLHLPPPLAPSFVYKSLPSLFSPSSFIIIHSQFHHQFLPTSTREIIDCAYHFFCSLLPSALRHRCITAFTTSILHATTASLFGGVCQFLQGRWHQFLLSAGGR